MKTRLSLLMVLAILLSLVFNPGVVHAQAGGSGTVVAWGYDGYGETIVPAGLSGVMAADGGAHHSLALKDDGTVVAWGYNWAGQTDVPVSLSNVIAIDAGSNHNLALKSDGTVITWGYLLNGPLTVPLGLSGVTAISAGGGHSLALKSDGTVVAWGDNWAGRTNVPVGLSGVIAISAGGPHSLALKSDGTVVAWGDDQIGYTDGNVPAPAGLSGVIAISAGGRHSLALKADGTVVAWGNNWAGQTHVPVGLTGVTAISAGNDHSLALKADGTIVAWGYNGYGEINVPAGLNNVIAIASGGNHNLAIKADGIVVTAPAVTTQPQSQAVYVGDTVSFSAAASGEPAPTVQWQVSTDGGTTWTNIAGATASPLIFTASLDQSSNQYHAVFTNSAGSATSSAATLTVSKIPATVTLVNLTQTYDGQPKPVTVTTYPAGPSPEVTYNGLPTAPTYAGSYAVVAAINDPTYEGSASGTLIVQPKAAFVMPTAAGKLYGETDPVLTGTLEGFLTTDHVIATYSRTAGEAVGHYIISAVLGSTGVLPNVLDNYNITYNTATFTIATRPVTVTADAKTKFTGEPDPPLTYQITNGSLAFSDAFSGALIRDPGEAAGVYPILQGTLALNSNYALTYVGADFTIIAAPVADPGGPYLGAVNTAILFDGSLSSGPENDPLTYAWDFGDGAPGTGTTPIHSYTAAGIYNVCLIVNIGTVVSTPACTIAVVYDPSAGFVTGGGWIESPAGAYKADETLAGKATFGFISKYQKGASVPTGKTAFEFDLAGLAFSSQSYEWLVVNQASSNAQFKGAGLINGALAPNGNAYNFMLWASDGTPDTFRIRIWWEDAAGEHDVYDNGVNQPISGGNIVVHTKK